MRERCAQHQSCGDDKMFFHKLLSCDDGLGLRDGKPVAENVGGDRTVLKGAVCRNLNRAKLHLARRRNPQNSSTKFPVKFFAIRTNEAIFALSSGKSRPLVVQTTSGSPIKQEENTIHFWKGNQRRNNAKESISNLQKSGRARSGGVWPVPCHTLQPRGDPGGIRPQIRQL